MALYEDQEDVQSMARTALDAGEQIILNKYAEAQAENRDAVRRSTGQFMKCTKMLRMQRCQQNLTWEDQRF